jgi:chromosome partitioning protein
MNIIAITNNKGGVGKSTVTAHLSYALTHHHQCRVLAVDCDPQANLSILMGLTQLSEKSATPFTHPIVQAACGVAVLPSSAALQQTERELSRSDDVYSLQTRLSGLAGGYDFVLLDCPPAFDFLSRNALVAATDVCIVSLPSVLAMQGLVNAVTFVREMQRYNTSLAISSFIVSQCDPRKRLHAEVCEAYARQFPASYIPHTIRNSVRVEEAAAQHKTVFETAAKSSVAADYSAVAQHFFSLYTHTSTTTTKKNTDAHHKSKARAHAPAK